MGIQHLDLSYGGYVPVESLQQHSIIIPHDQSRTPSPASSLDDVFSVASDISSQSSQGDSLVECTQDSVQLATAQVQSLSGNARFPPPAKAEALPAAQLQHPRRSSSSAKRTPPPLPRQEERKVLFVNDLVDSATNLVSVIWPLSNLPCGQSTVSRGVLPLRRYIEETLRRSRTSYSTLQVALYYLVLIKSHVPRYDFTMEQSADCASLRAMQCGRRMFLAALILASKYLQDRNYSAKAWSKMSGLKTTEINSNERMFLNAVCWKLHIPDCIFKRWTDIVLQFTAQPGSAPTVANGTVYEGKALWAQLTPLLTPTLDDQRIRILASKARPQGTSHLQADSAQHVRPSLTLSPPLMAHDSPASAANVTPRFLEPRPDMEPPTPGLVRMGPLRTPSMTPASIAASTPAASTCSSRRPSMAMAMSQVSSNLLCRTIIDRMPAFCTQRTSAIRSSSAMTTTALPSNALWSSPESMISDGSRASQTSPLSTASTASESAPIRVPPRPATYRSTSGPILTRTKKCENSGSSLHAITIPDEPKIIDIDVDLEALSPTLRTCSFQPDITPPSESRKRCHSRLSSVSSDDDSDLQQQVRQLLASSIRDPNVAADECVATPKPHLYSTETAMAKLAAYTAQLRTGQLSRESESQRPKRQCFSLGPQTYVPSVYMQVKQDVWEGVS